MKGYWRVLCVALLAMPALALAADRQGCDKVNFSADVLAKFPNAQAACREVKEKNGGIYIHHRADVVAVDNEGVTVHMINHDGKAISKVKFASTADALARVDGRSLSKSGPVALHRGTGARWQRRERRAVPDRQWQGGF